MPPKVINSSNDGDPARQEPNEAALAYGINTNLYPKAMPFSKSHEALAAWRGSGGDNAYRELSYGEVQFSVAYLEASKKLFVHVGRVSNIPPKGVCFKYSVALKIAIMPNEKHTKITSTRSGVSSSGELNAEFSDEFHFFLKELTGHVLRISVFDADFMGRYDAIGHALYYLEDIPVGKRTPLSMKLYKQSQPDQYPGSLEVSLHYDAMQDKMTIKVMQARNLTLSPQATHNWRSIDNISTYVKVTYYCAGKRIKSSRSPNVSNTRNPVYSHTAEFILASNYPHEIYFVVQVLLPGLIRKDPPVGRLIFGPFYYADDRTETPWGLAMRTNDVVTHWYNMYL